MEYIEDCLDFIIVCNIIKLHHYNEVILSMQPWPGRVLYAVKNDPPVEYSISFITNTL